jgi:hypothetical protein
MKRSASNSAAATAEVIVDPEFEALCPPSSAEEIELLEASLKRGGCRERLAVWTHPSGQILLDGHTRRRICIRLNIPFETIPIDLDDRGAAVNWIIANQLGRRNLSEEQKSYLRGKRYETEKKAHRGAGKKKGGQAVPRQKTAERLGDEYGVSSKTIKRDADFAAGVDRVAKTEGEQAKRDILAGKSNRTKRDVAAVAKPAAANRTKKAAAKATSAPKDDGLFESLLGFSAFDEQRRVLLVTIGKRAAVNALRKAGAHDGRSVTDDDVRRAAREMAAGSQLASVMEDLG